VLCSTGSLPPKIEPASPFIDTRRGGIHAQEIAEVVVLSLNRGGAVVEHCRKCTMGYDVRRGSHPGHRPWPCGDHAGVLTALEGGVVVPVESIVPRVRRSGAPRVPQAGVLPWSRSGPLPRAVPMPFVGSTEGKARGKYGELVAQWLEQCRARLAQHRRFPQWRHSIQNGGAVSGVGGRDSGHSHCAEWRPDAI